MVTAVSRWRRLAAILRTQLVVLMVSLIGYEIALQLLFASPFAGVLEPPPLLISDAALRFRGNPRHPEHDARGYRNPSTVSTADVVTIGDSHTYGIGVRRQEAWPAVLPIHSGRTVYSMAHGGYGPGQYERMLAEALTLQPQIIVVGLHTGNDFYDAYAFARGQTHPPRLADLAGRAAALDRVSPIDEEGARLFSRGRRSRVREWLGDHVALYRLAHHVRRQLVPPPFLAADFQTAVAALTPVDRAYVSMMHGPGWRTILRAPYTHLGTNRHDPRILLGFELTIDALQSIALQCRKHGVDLLVVVIPTKESVFWPRVTNPESHPQLREAVDDETALRAALIRRLVDVRVPVLNVLPTLRAAVVQPYSETLDGHPNAAGHRIIAAQVAAWTLDHRSGVPAGPAPGTRASGGP